MVYLSVPTLQGNLPMVTLGQLMVSGQEEHSLHFLQVLLGYQTRLSLFYKILKETSMH